MENKSISIFTNYPDACLAASLNEDLFNVFKSNPDYNQVLEHVTIDFGLDYLNVIKRENPQLLEKPYIDKFKENDLYGNGYIHNYDGLLISPSTLRYIKVLSDLINIYGDLKGFKIAEIGGGYGGQCKIIKDYFEIKDYHIIDLESVNRLSEKYLDKLKVKNVRFSTSNTLNEENYNLVISNYAYTELDRGLQDLYKIKIIDKSDNGYITCNFINGFIPGSVFPTYTKEELLNLKVNTEILPEEPLTFPNNFILIWKK